MSDLIFNAFAVVVMWGSFRLLKWNNRQKAYKRAPARVTEAAQRGWSYEQEQTMMFEIERWKGSTDGVEWVGEAARTGTQRSLTDVAARKGSETAGDEGQQDEIAKSISEITSPLARRMIGKVVDAGFSVRFGRPIGANVEGTALKPVILPATGYDGYSLMATDPSEASAHALSERTICARRSDTRTTRGR